MQSLKPPLTPFVDKVPMPQRLVFTEPGRVVIPLETAQHRFHRDLPPSQVWTYGGSLPGPTIEVNRGVELEVRWENHLTGRLPVVVTVAPEFAVDGVPAQCMPGRSGGRPDPAAAALSGFAVVHLHGGMTQASSDGWTENIAAPGQAMLDAYPNDQRAAMLWYHDHVMGVTRFNVYAGLAGLWIVRDDRERELELPEGPPYEVPLLLSDRNFDLDDDGRLTGDLLHKTDPEVMECFSPFTTVNGTVWPHLDVEPTTYRFRLLNGSNARTYRLVLTRDGEPDHGRITQIGSEGGLLQAPVSIPGQGLVLASAERADLLVDFSDLAAATELTLWNTAAAPFDGAFADPVEAGQANIDGLLPYPEVLRIRVGEGRSSRRRIPQVLATDFQRPSDDELGSAVVRAIALVEQEAPMEGAPPMLTMRELVLDPVQRIPPSRSSSRNRTARNVSRAGARSRHASRTRPPFSRCCTDLRSGGSSTSRAIRIRFTFISTHSGSSTDTRRRSSSLRTGSRPEERAQRCVSARLPRTASRTSSTTTSSA